MKKVLLLIGSVAVAGILYACGGSSSNNNTSTIGVAAPSVSTPRAISTSTDAAKTASSSKTMATALVKGGIPNLGSLIGKAATNQPQNGHRIVSTILGVQNKLLELKQKPLLLGKAVAAASSPYTETTTCDSGFGTRTITFTLDNTNTILTSMSITANNCKENYQSKNGTIALSGLSVPLQGFDATTLDLSNLKLTLNLVTIDYSDTSYISKSYETAENVTIKIGAGYSSTNMSLNLDGSLSEIDYDPNNLVSSKSSFANFSMKVLVAGLDYTVTLDGAASMATYNDTKFSSVDTKSGMTFNSLKIVNRSLTNGGTSVTMNGTYAIAAIPSCMDGTYVITTDANNPIIADSYGMTIGGKMTVNGVDMQFLANGDVSTKIGTQTTTVTAADAQAAANACQLSFSEGIL